MSFKTTVLLPHDQFCFLKLLIDSIQLEEGFMYLFGSSPLTSPERSLPPSSASSPLSTPPASPLSSPRLLAFPIMTDDDDVPPQSMPSQSLAPVQLGPPNRPTHAKRQGHANWRRKREREREAAKLESQERIRPYKPRPATVKKHVKSSKLRLTKYNSDTIPIVSSGYVALPGPKSSSKFPLEQRFKMQKVVWDGTFSIPIVDEGGQYIGLCAGSDASDWPDMHQSAAAALEEARGGVSWGKEDRRHRRGTFFARNVGISHGGGQTRPMVLRHNAPDDAVLSGLLKHPLFVRMAGHASGIFATWAPRLHSYYADHLQKLLDHDETLTHNFENSVFAGSHLVLWDLGLVIEFPPGSTIFIPSASLDHSNASIQKEERRYSFTQYTAGGTFRWVDYGFQKADEYLASLSEEEQQAAAEEGRDRLAFGLSLFSTIDEFQ
ncbi:uncharacterized protein LACBIDRAFT_299476 [Laccaria bicolor S238N-H82]|uniref:Predicted protein n=1 Tax=Laccaria bicolor (strain S238N-H82 / ATCC MYA-4686) TaxID=486041 RepID=B0DES9_LACBS|nr:uncharacterized protein LACBIDRAFT_299476 [Laccaria bicolor S238N-H82]EDR06992.1 predicted protein [Laccaria bicolor S238N-H82]|eukprot:XP_001882365.1 predicted protein [Laccaria bicolor S238N-H82]